MTSTDGIDLETRIRKAPRIAARTIDGQAVVVQLDRQELHTLNEVGTRVFELADGRSLASIVDAVLGEFEVSRELAERDVAAFARELVRLGAVETLG